MDFGDRHEYYYCEFVKNSLASYTHDHQMSRIDHSDLDYVDANGNGKFDMGEVVNSCKNHNHEAEGTETVIGELVLKEDKQAIYIPYRQLFGGYGWGMDGYDLGEEGVTSTYSKNVNEWSLSTITLSGEGYAQIIINDYTMCKPASVTIKVVTEIESGGDKDGDDGGNDPSDW